MNIFHRRHHATLFRTTAKKRRGGFALRIFLISLFSIFGVLNLIQVNAASTRGFTMSELEEQIGTLVEEQRHIDFEIARYGSLASIHERIKDAGFVPMEEIQYIQDQESAFARR